MWFRPICFGALVLSAAAPASAQLVRTERVQLTEKTSGVNLVSSARQGSPALYLVSLDAGQRLVATASTAIGPAACQVRIFDPGEPIPQRYLSFNYRAVDLPAAGETSGATLDLTTTPTQAGEYQVLLFNMLAGRGVCSVNISVE